MTEDFFDRHKLSDYDRRKLWICERCGHDGEAVRGGSCCVIHFYCAKCGDLMWEKDVS